MDARRESAAILSYCKGDGRSRRGISVEFNSVEDFSACNLQNVHLLCVNAGRSMQIDSFGIFMCRVYVEASDLLFGSRRLFVEEIF